MTSFTGIMIYSFIYSDLVKCARLATVVKVKNAHCVLIVMRQTLERFTFHECCVVFQLSYMPHRPFIIYRLSLYLTNDADNDLNQNQVNHTHNFNKSGFQFKSTALLRLSRSSSPSARPRDASSTG